MSRESYPIIKALFYLMCVALGATASKWPRRKHPAATAGQKAVLTFASMVMVTAVLYPLFLLYVEKKVGIRDEGIQVAFEYLIFVGPAAALSLLLSVTSREIRKVGSLLSLSYLVGALGIFVSAMFE